VEGRAVSRISAAAAAEALRDWGVDFRPWGAGWADRTTAGGWDPIGIAHHHTAGSGVLAHDSGKLGASQRSMLDLLTRGRPDLDGPLCHLAPTFLGKGKKAAVFGIGWGNCNHAGFIDNDVARALRAGSFAGGGRGGPETVDGNSILYGLEYLHPGDGTPWPEELLEAGHRAAAALCEAHGWKPGNWAGSNAEHRELTTRKIDRSWSGAGDGMRKQIEALARGDVREPAPWVRTADVQAAIRSLVAAADDKARVGRKRQAAALRSYANDLRVRFPALPEKERG
jgi:hypothetical protein